MDGYRWNYVDDIILCTDVKLILTHREKYLVYLIHQLIVFFTYFRFANILSRLVFPAPDGPRIKVRRPGLKDPQTPFKMIWSPDSCLSLLIQAREILWIKFPIKPHYCNQNSPLLHSRILNNMLIEIIRYHFLKVSTQI